MMEKLQTYDVGGFQFDTKKSISLKASSILKSTPSGSRLEGEEEIFMAGLLRHHPKINQKIGVGLSLIKVFVGAYGAKRFCVVRKDGSIEEFSYKICVNNCSK